MLLVLLLMKYDLSQCYDIDLILSLSLSISLKSIYKYDAIDSSR